MKPSFIPYPREGNMLPRAKAIILVLAGEENDTGDARTSGDEQAWRRARRQRERERWGENGVGKGERGRRTRKSGRIGRKQREKLLYVTVVLAQ